MHCLASTSVHRSVEELNLLLLGPQVERLHIELRERGDTVSSLQVRSAVLAVRSEQSAGEIWMAWYQQSCSEKLLHMCLKP